jgi:hypothetical protein
MRFEIHLLDPEVALQETCWYVLLTKELHSGKQISAEPLHRFFVMQEGPHVIPRDMM